MSEKSNILFSLDCRLPYKSRPVSSGLILWQMLTTNKLSRESELSVELVENALDVFYDTEAEQIELVLSTVS